MVLLKSYDPTNGFTIFTNYESRKGTEIVCLWNVDNQIVNALIFSIRRKTRMLLSCSTGIILAGKFAWKDAHTRFQHKHRMNILANDHKCRKCQLELVPNLGRSIRAIPCYSDSNKNWNAFAMKSQSQDQIFGVDITLYRKDSNFGRDKAIDCMTVWYSPVERNKTKCNGQCSVCNPKRQRSLSD